MIGVSSEMIAIADDLRAAGAAFSTFPCDLRRWDEIKVLADPAVEAHGPLDIWVNNAGIGYIMKPFFEVSPEDWSAVIDVNLTGVFYGMKASAIAMVAAGKGGRIVNIAR